MKDLTQEIRKITLKYGKEFIANDDFLDELKSKLQEKDFELNQKLFVYTVLRDEKVLSKLDRIQKKDIPEYVEREISYLSEKYGLEEYIVSNVFKELLVGSGIAQENNEFDGNNNESKTDLPQSTQRLQNKQVKSRKEIKGVNRPTVYCTCTLFWTILCLFFLPLIPASIEEEFDLPGIIPSFIHYLVSIVPLLFLLTSSKQSQIHKTVAGGVLASVLILTGLFLSFGLFDYDYYPYMYEYNWDMSHGINNVGKMISNNLGVIIISMVISSMVGWFVSYIFLLLKEQELSEIIAIFRQNKRIFFLSLAISAIFMITIGYFVLKYGIVELLVDIAGEFIANLYKWIIIALIALIFLLILS